jgi:two-component system, LuxR family, sensor kinase FixL
VVGRQQGQAKAALGILESVALPVVVDEALRLAGLTHPGNEDGITVERSYVDMPRARLDRHKLMETLTNLLGNARHALQSSPGPRTLRVEIRPQAESRFLIEIVDSGCGISPENLPRIFTFGFSTKPGGHGFGLHASAIATAEMGGTLTAHSDGPSRGARFRLELPLRPLAGAAGSRPGDDFGPLGTPPPEVLNK